MKRPRLVPVVEITTRPPKGRITRPISSPSTDTPSPPRPAKKRKKETSSRPPNKISHSPTISDFECMLPEVPAKSLRASPTVSEFALPDTNDDVPHPCRSGVGSPVNAPRRRTPNVVKASGSTVTLDTVEDAYTYEIQGDEIIEDHELNIPGESPLDATDNQYVPVRLLQDFTVYDLETSVTVPVAELTMLHIQKKRKYGASGIAKPWRDEEGEEDEDVDEDGDDEDGDETSMPTAGERIKLSQILEFNTHDYPSTGGSLDSKIYIRTKYAWYILDSPSAAYRPFFLSFWIKHRIVHVLVLSAMANLRMTYDEFMESLEFTETANELTQSTFNFLGRDLTQEEVEHDDVHAYIAATLPDILNQGIRISRVPAIRSFFPAPDLLDDIAALHPRREGKGKVSSGGRGDKERLVLKERTNTKVTSRVRAIAKNLFKGNLELAGSSTFDKQDAAVAEKMGKSKTHRMDPKSVTWGDTGHNGYFESIIMDGVEYRVGDDVMVNPGDDEDHTRAKNAKADASQSVNSYANRVWFCKICYFYEKAVKGKLVKMFHGQWFVHGSRTFLQETSHSKALYLINKCEDNPVASIFRKCHIYMIGPKELEPFDDAQSDAEDFYCNLIYDEEKVEFRNLPDDDEIKDLLSYLPDSQPCISCAMDVQAENNEFRSIDKDCAFIRFGIKYHLNDFVYIRPGDGLSGVYEIGQITKITNLPEEPTVTVRCFGRHDDRPESDELDDHSMLFKDERRLYRQYETKAVLLCQLDGVCYVRQLLTSKEIDDWVKYDDHFYVNEKELEDGSLIQMDENILPFCTACFEKHETQLQDDEELLEENPKLVGLELFSGAGGLGTGMDMSGFVETKYAVEFSPSAAATYQLNHPKTTVYNQDSNTLLRDAIEMEDGEHTKPLLSKDGKTYLPSMPRKGEVDFIYGGPPCQSFSRANHSRHADDIRSTLPANMLSYVEHYNPKYFLLENVAGLLDYPLMSTQNGRSLEGGIKSGVVKFILRTLLALGYQVRYNLLQAGQYGAPQSRRRVIFIGAKRGLKLPHHPVPLYGFKKGSHRTTLPTGGHLLPVTRSLNVDDPHQCAPFRPITVNDAIGDLPPFDWINPHDVFPATRRDKETTAERRRQGILQCDAVAEKGGKTVLPGFPKGVAYASQPQNRYQKWLRQKMEEGALVEGHYTKRFASKIVEATACVPLKPGVDHRSLRHELLPNHAMPGRGDKKALYGRMNGEEQFKCVMTTLSPNMKNSWSLHPSQKRMVSVRELARAQGFPDNYIFKSADEKGHKKVDNQLRQIGNAVPVPLALALGKAIGRAWLDDIKASRRREMSPAA